MTERLRKAQEAYRVKLAGRSAYERDEQRVRDAERELAEAKAARAQVQRAAQDSVRAFERARDELVAAALAEE